MFLNHIGTCLYSLTWLQHVVIPFAFQIFSSRRNATLAYPILAFYVSLCSSLLALYTTKKVKFSTTSISFPSIFNIAFDGVFALKIFVLAMLMFSLICADVCATAKMFSCIWAWVCERSCGLVDDIYQFARWSKML